MSGINCVVTDGLWRKSLSVIRALGKHKFNITVMGDSLFTTGFWSTYTQRKVLEPTASIDPEGFGHALLKTLKDFDSRPILFPMEDPSLMWVADNLEKIEHLAHILLPPLESLKIAQDKGRTISVAKEIGIACPKTLYASSVDEFVKNIASVQKDFPDRTFLVKPVTGTGSSGIIYNLNLPEEEWRKHWDKHGSLIVQERIPPEGRGIGVSLLFNRAGECSAYFVHERLQQYPITGGPSTDRRSIYDPYLVEQSIKLLKHLSWRGIAMVEWKENPSTKIAQLMEINPRFWGSLELAVRSGVNFPLLYAKAAMGEDLPEAIPYKEGLRCRWMMPGEILRYLNQAPKDREGIRGFLKGLPGLAEEWDKDDLPGALATIICPAVLAINPRYWKYFLKRGKQ